MAFEQIEGNLDTTVKPSVEVSDADLIILGNRWLAESEPFHQELEGIWKTNEAYYLGNQTEIERVPAFSSDAVQNHEFMGVETVVPIITSNTPQFLGSPVNEDELSATMADSVEKILGIRYEEGDFRSKIEQAVRHMIIYRYGVLKPFWNEYIDDWDVKAVHPRRLYFPRYGSRVEDVRMCEKIDMDFDEIEALWGAEALAKVKQYSESQPEDRDKVSRTAQVWEFWTNDFVFWKCGPHILAKQLNPYFDFEGHVDNKLSLEGTEIEQTLFNNHFRRPLKPYIILSAFRLGNSLVGQTDLITQSRPIQDIINVTLRSVINSAQRMGNPAWMIDSSVMTREEAENQITNEPGLILLGTDAANPARVRRDAPPPIPNYIINLLNSAQSAFDNIFGTHSTTRGERREPETLGGRLLLKQADLGRIDLLVREVERGVAELGNWGVQMMRMYYDKERTFKIYGQDGLKFITVSKHLEGIGAGIQMIVKSGSTLPTDEVSRRNEALQLYQLGALDPISLYERLKWPNPEETFARLQAYQTGQLQQKMMMDQAAQAAQGTPAATPQVVNPLLNPQAELGQANNSINK